MLLPSPLRFAVRGLLLSSLAWCTACGATGLAWVGEAQLESAAQQRVIEAHSTSISRPPSATIPATAEQSATEPRPRLNRTVTLGEVEAFASRTEGTAAGTPGPTVIVNNYQLVNVAPPAFGFGNYGYSRAAGGFSPVHVTPHRAEPRAPGPLPGQSWPAVADHGPSFPFQTSPASPWTRTQ